ncbi:MAG TPA: hypothetical protein VFH77_03100 [Streptomyces sp.]|nr:hypothetical protein [Streptomyces sp.]
MPNYNNQNTRLTASDYAWDVTFVIGKLRTGNNPSQDCSGSYTTQPGATVGSLLNGLATWYAQNNGVRTKDVTIVRYSLREK